MILLSAAFDIVTMQNKHKADFLLEYALQMKKNGFGPLAVLQHVAKQFVWGHTPHKHLGGPFTQFHINLKEKTLILVIFHLFLHIQSYKPKNGNPQKNVKPHQIFKIQEATIILYSGVAKETPLKCFHFCLAIKGVLQKKFPKAGFSRFQIDLLKSHTMAWINNDFLQRKKNHALVLCCQFGHERQ